MGYSFHWVIRWASARTGAFGERSDAGGVTDPLQSQRWGFIGMKGVFAIMPH
jgi:hypothetical protein